MVLCGLVYRIYKLTIEKQRRCAVNQDTSRYEILYDLPKGEYNAAEVGGIRTRTVRAGDTLEVECYPLTRIGPAAKAEAARRHHQRACQERQNRKNAEKKVRRLIEHNFTTDSYVLTLTWDYGQIDRFRMSEGETDQLWQRLSLPIDEEDARRALNNFFRRVRTRMRQLGEDPRALKYLYVLELTHQNKGPYTHYHFHLVIDAPGLGARELDAIWGLGFTRCDHLSKKSEGAAGLAHYLTKHHSTEELRNDGSRMRRWGRSKNLNEPPETVSDRRISRRRAALIAGDVMYDAKAVFESIKAYEDYDLVDVKVHFSDFVAGAYIFARLRYSTRKAEENRKRQNEKTARRR